MLSNRSEMHATRSGSPNRPLVGDVVVADFRDLPCGKRRLGVVVATPARGRIVLAPITSIGSRLDQSDFLFHRSEYAFLRYETHRVQLAIQVPFKVGTWSHLDGARAGNLPCLTPADRERLCTHLDLVDQ